MSQFDSSKDYYNILGADENSSLRDIERRYKRLASRHHPDRGGSEDEMKTLNEAYRVLKDESIRHDYDLERNKPTPVAAGPVVVAPARDVGASGQALSSFLCLLMGLFLLVLVRSQWIWFLWPLAILAFFVIVFGVLLAHGAMLSFREALPESNPIRRHTVIQEALFWMIVGVSGIGIYLLLRGVD
jgi:hypothetical protein